MADESANLFHSADNPGNYANILNNVLKIGASQLAPQVVPTSASARNTVAETPGITTPQPSPQLGEDDGKAPGFVKQYGIYIAAGIGLLLAIVALRGK